MGALTSVLATTLVSGLTQSVSNNQAVAQLSARQDLEAQQSKQDASLEKRSIALDASVAEQDRKDALKRSIARQRAEFGAQGVGSAGGSSGAVLLGIIDESEEEKAQREALDSIKVRAIDDSLEQQKALNVLQREQLRERSSLDSIAGGLGRIF